MRWIQAGEPVMTAGEIAAQVEQNYGVIVHPTVIGQTAVRLGLDYLEQQQDMTVAGGRTVISKRKAYSVLDLPAIVAELQRRDIQHRGMNAACDGSDRVR